MAADLVTTVADQLAERIFPWWTEDFDTFVRAIGAMFSQVEQYAQEREDGTAGWSIMLDPDEAPAAGLAYLAQWVGERFTAGLSESEQRLQIKDNPNARRGTIESIARVAQRSLTGARTVQIVERVLEDGSSDASSGTPGHHGLIFTYTDETPNPAKTWADLVAFALPADQEWHHHVVDGATWLSISETYATWEDVRTSFGTWDDVRGARTGSSVWTR